MKYILILALLFFSVMDCFSIPFRFMPMGYLNTEPTVNDSWELDVNTELGGGVSRKYTIYISQASDIRVDYGDGSISNYTTSGIKTHTYIDTGTYTLNISGSQPSGYIQLSYDTPEKVSRFDVLGLGINDLIDTTYMFSDCDNISTFASDAFLNQTNIANLYSTWSGCSSVTNLPEVNHLTSVTNLHNTWSSCYAIKNFPDVYNLTNVVDLAGTWFWCLTATNFPEVNTLTNIITLNSTWSGCTNARSFPDVYNLTKNKSLLQTWVNAHLCTNFPAVNTMTNVENLLFATWSGCRSATNFPIISSLTKVTELQYTWDGCIIGKTFPEINTLTNVVRISYAWRNDVSATNFPSISNLTNIYSMSYAWYGCTNARTFPTFFSKNTSLTNVSYTFYNCTNMTGAAPELWNVANFPNITVYTNCFYGLDPAKVSNWGSIPAGWK